MTERLGYINTSLVSRGEYLGAKVIQIIGDVGLPDLANKNTGHPVKSEF